MTNRKMLYGYRIQNGDIVAVEAEALVVSRVFTLYTTGASYRKIADTLNNEGIPYSREVPEWNKHKVKRMLENPRYTGQDGYPAIVDGDVFQAAQAAIREKTASYTPKPDRPALRFKERLRCGHCGKALFGLGGKGHRPDTLYLKCSECGTAVTIPDADLLDEVARQWAEHSTPSQEPYQPSGEVIRLTNAINRGLERPDSPEDIIALILQGASARYDCCPAAIQYESTDRPSDVDHSHIRQAVSYITISADNTVAVTFK